MKALILTGGKGTRLRPITHTSAKQLIPIANKPILFYGLETIANCGIKEIGFIVGDTKKEIIHSIGDGSKWGIKPTFIEQEAPLGLAHAVKISKDFIKEDNFIMYLGDNLLKDADVILRELLDKFNKYKPNSLILLTQVKNPEAFGVAELKQSKVVRLVEKPKNPPSNLALVGIYIFDKNIFQAVNSIKPSWRGELEITDAIQYLIEKGFRVESHIVKGWWKDTGKLEDMLEANRIILEEIETKINGNVTIDEKTKIEGRAIIDENVRIENSVIRGPVVIGKNSKIINSYIGPFSSIYFNVEIINSEIEHSIILENTKILNLPRIEDSLIGQNVEIVKSDKKPVAYRIMVGDSSKLEL